MYKLCVYIPEAQLESVKRALFDAGAGRIGNYSDCCWQVLGSGQFRPGEGSDPFLGDRDRLETLILWILVYPSILYNFVSFSFCP